MKQNINKKVLNIIIYSYKYYNYNNIEIEVPQ